MRKRLCVRQGYGQSDRERESESDKMRNRIRKFDRCGLLPQWSRDDGNEVLLVVCVEVFYLDGGFSLLKKI